MSEKAEEKKDLSEFIKDFFKKTNIQHLNCSEQSTVKMECCVDLDMNVVPESKNKLILEFSFPVYPTEWE